MGMSLEIIDVCVVVEGMYTYKTGDFGNNPFCLYFVVADGIYTCKTGNFGN